VLRENMNKPKFLYGWYTVAASWIMIFLMSAVTVGLFFKPILEDFGWDRATLSLAQSVALIAYMLASPFLGRFIDRSGPRLMILVCVGTQFFSRLLNGVAGTFWHFSLARFFYEVKVLPGTQVLTSRWFVKKRGTAQGILASGMPVGLLVLVPISQYLILLWGWRPTMLFWAAVTLVVMLPLALMIRNNPEDRGYAPDGEPLDEVRPVVPPPRPGGVDRGAGHGVKTGSGLREAVKTRPFWFLTAAHFICGIGCGFMTTHIVIFATDFGYSDMIAASLLSVQGGLNIVGVLVTGHLADRMAGSKVLALTHFVRTMSFATIIVFILFGGGSLWILYLGMAFFGFGWFTTAPLTAGLVAGLFGNLRMGTILGVTTSSHILGWSIGAYVGGVIFDMTHSYYTAFLIITLLSLLATVFSLAIKQKQHFE